MLGEALRTTSPTTVPLPAAAVATICGSSSMGLTIPTEIVSEAELAVLVANAEAKALGGRNHHFHQQETPVVEESTATSSSRLQETFAGLIAGGVGKVVEHPMDTVKVRLQEEAGLYRNAVDCCKRMLREEGRSSFFRGIWPPLFVSAYEHAFTFVAYNASLGFVEKQRHRWNSKIVGDSSSGGPPLRLQQDFTSLDARAKMPLSTHILAGAGSGLLSAHVLTPAEFIKCRQQQRGKDQISVRQLLGNGGWHRLFDGHVATVAREVPGTASWFFFYEASLRFFTGGLWAAPAGTNSPAAKSSEDLPATTVAFCGGLAGVAYWSVFYPADVVKTRMQLSPEACKLGFRRCLVNIYRKEGMKALYAGWACMALSAFPSNGAIFLVYEKLRLSFGGLSSD